jgi:beta-mannosidase
MSNSPTSPTCGWVLAPEFVDALDEQMGNTKRPRIKTLEKDWEWKQRNRKESEQENLQSQAGWTPTTVPTEIFKDLLKAKQVEDPHADQNEKQIQWVGEVDWLYRTQFTSEHIPSGQEKVVLAFDGLDTFASVYLNGSQILKTEVIYLRFIDVEYVS